MYLSQFIKQSSQKISIINGWYDITKMLYHYKENFFFNLFIIFKLLQGAFFFFYIGLIFYSQLDIFIMYFNQIAKL